MRQLTVVIIALWFGFVALMTGCSTGNVGTSVGNPTTPSERAFPTEFAVASPFNLGEETGAAVSARLSLATADGFVSQFDSAIETINIILEADTLEDCAFDPNQFLSLPHDAACFGPIVEYENHPEAGSSGPDDGSLPPGDLGIWTETDTVTGDACAAAELNTRLGAAEDQAIAALSGLASLICVAQVNDLDFPDNGSLTLTTELNAVGMAGVSISNATLSHEDSGDEIYRYTLEFSFTKDGQTSEMSVEMEHHPGDSSASYTGIISFLADYTVNLSGNCEGSEVATNGSLLYNKASDNALAFEMRSGQFCGHGASGLDEDGLVDPAETYDPVSNPDGWGNNFSRFTANFNPETLVGDYAYSWQAGPMDSNTRVFNIGVSEGGETLSGEAFAGFGDTIDESDGSITGFICNWTGPGSTHTLQALTQAQNLSFDEVSGLFVSDEANILYAPTTTCNYDGSGDFRYDKDLDGEVDAAGVVTHGLLSLDAIGASGFELPTAPDLP